MLKNTFVRIAIATGILLLIPLVLTLTGSGVDGDGWHWTAGDFVFMFALIFGSASLFELARRKAAGNAAYVWAAGIAFADLFFLIWINGAVGIIGDSEINMLYALVGLTLVTGTAIVRLRPRGMSVTLIVAAVMQAAIPVIALAVHTPDFSPGVLRVFVLNAVFVVAFLSSAFLFRLAGKTP